MSEIIRIDQKVEDYLDRLIDTESYKDKGGSTYVYFDNSTNTSLTSGVGRYSKYFFASILSGALFFISSFFKFASSRSKYMQSKDIKSLSEKRSDVLELDKKVNPKEKDFYEDLTVLSNSQEKIDSVKYRKDKIYLGSSLGLASSAAMFLSSNKNAQICGGVGLVFSTVSAITNAIYHRTLDAKIARRQDANSLRALKLGDAVGIAVYER